MYFIGEGTNDLLKKCYHAYLCSDNARYFHQWYFDEHFRPEKHYLPNIPVMSSEAPCEENDNKVISATWIKGRLVLEKAWKNQIKYSTDPSRIVLHHSIQLETETHPEQEFGGFTSEGEPTLREIQGTFAKNMISSVILRVIRVDQGMSLAMSMFGPPPPIPPRAAGGQGSHGMQSPKKSASTRSSARSPAKSPLRGAAKSRSKVTIPANQLLLGASTGRQLLMKAPSPVKNLPFKTLPALVPDPSDIVPGPSGVSTARNQSEEEKKKLQMQDINARKYATRVSNQIEADKKAKAKKDKQYDAIEKNLSDNAKTTVRRGSGGSVTIVPLGDLTEPNPDNFRFLQPSQVLPASRITQEDLDIQVPMEEEQEEDADDPQVDPGEDINTEVDPTAGAAVFLTLDPLQVSQILPDIDIDAELTEDGSHEPALFKIEGDGGSGGQGEGQGGSRGTQL